MQFVEGLTDRQAADAVRTRIDWHDVLCLELTDVAMVAETLRHALNVPVTYSSTSRIVGRRVRPAA